MQAVNRLIAAGLAIAGLGTIGYSCLYTVDAGHRALIFDRLNGGIKPTVYGEGTHFYVPWIQTPIIYDVRTTPRNIKSETGSKDLQTIKLTLRVLYRPDETRLPEIHRNLGLDYAERVLPSVGNEVLKAVVARFDAGELITQREHISRLIRDRITKRCFNEFGITLDDVALTHVSFSPDYTRSVEQKQVAQQEAERAKYIVAKTEQEKRAQIIQAEGEAEAARLIQAAMASGPGYMELLRINTAREIAEILSRSKSITYLPSGGNILYNLPAGAQSQSQ